MCLAIDFGFDGVTVEACVCVCVTVVLVVFLKSETDWKMV